MLGCNKQRHKFPQWNGVLLLLCGLCTLEMSSSTLICPVCQSVIAKQAHSLTYLYVSVSCHCVYCVTFDQPWKPISISAPKKSNSIHIIIAKIDSRHQCCHDTFTQADKQLLFAQAIHSTSTEHTLQCVLWHSSRAVMLFNDHGFLPKVYYWFSHFHIKSNLIQLCLLIRYFD